MHLWFFLLILAKDFVVDNPAECLWWVCDFCCQTYLWMNFAALKTQSPLGLFAKKAITNCLEAGTCVQSPFMLLLALKGINQRVKQSSHPELSQDAGICLHPSAHGAWREMFSWSNAGGQTMPWITPIPRAFPSPGSSHTGMGISPGTVP